MARVLIVDDEPGLRTMAAVVLRRDGHEVAQAGSLAEARTALNAGTEVVLTDLRMDDGDGLAVLAAARVAAPDAMVVVMTAFAEWSTAVDAMRHGAFSFLAKPFDNDLLRDTVRRAAAARERRITARRDGEAHFGVHLVGESPEIRAVQTLIDQVATTDSTVLITGESGTGKELVARAIHDASLRADGPLMRINSGALAPSLLESELFGHMKGSFTGATDDRPGLIELAQGGTLFLDEVGDLAPETQVKLLRVLENREFIAVGGREVKRADVRVVAATNRDLEQMVAAGTFREDLYYRLAVIPVALPPLRSRRVDIPLIAGHLLARHAVKLRREVQGFSEEALAHMQRHPWPGNIRELDNRIQRGVALTASGLISRQALFGETLGGGASGLHQAARPADPPASGLRTRLAQGESIDLEAETIAYEKALMEAALKHHHENMTEAAAQLGITFRQMRYKMRLYGMR